MAKDEKPRIITSLAKHRATLFTSVLPFIRIQARNTRGRKKMKAREVLLIRVGFKGGESFKLDRTLFGHSPPLKPRTHVPPR
jgi:hypothetical protein